MQELDFDSYRRCYYWFQLHFFLRGEQQGKRGLLSDFLNSLVLSPDEVHRRWEAKERRTAKPETPLKRIPKGMKKADAIKAEKIRQGAFPVKAFNNVFIAKYASQKSIRCRYMLFDWLRCTNGRRWDDFTGLYRSLIVFDLIDGGKTIDDIALMHGDDDTDLEYYLVADRIDDRRTLHYEVLSEIIGTDALDTVLNPVHCKDGSVFFHTYESLPLLKLYIKKQFNWALELIQLAKTGNFHNLSKLPPLKY